MRKTILFFTCLLLNLTIYGQTDISQTQNLTYQAVVRGQSNFLQINTNIDVKVSLINKSAEGTVNYVESHNAKTNENGLFTIKIGAGSTISGVYNDFKWYEGPVFLKTEITFKDQWNIDFAFTNVSELLSVPYSNFAYRSGGLIDNAEPFVGEYKYTDSEITENIFISRETKNTVQIRTVYTEFVPDPINKFSTNIDVEYGKIIDDKIEWYSLAKYNSNDSLEEYYTKAIITKSGDDLLVTPIEEDDEEPVIFKKVN